MPARKQKKSVQVGQRLNRSVAPVQCTSAKFSRWPRPMYRPIKPNSALISPFPSNSRSFCNLHELMLKKSSSVKLENAQKLHRIQNIWPETSRVFDPPSEIAIKKNCSELDRSEKCRLEPLQSGRRCPKTG